MLGLIRIVARFLNQTVTPDWTETFETCFHFHLLLATGCVAGLGSPDHANPTSKNFKLTSILGCAGKDCRTADFSFAGCHCDALASRSDTRQP
jgi:hypothetical protein